MQTYLDLSVRGDGHADTNHPDGSKEARGGLLELEQNADSQHNDGGDGFDHLPRKDLSDAPSLSRKEVRTDLDE